MYMQRIVKPIEHKQEWDHFLNEVRPNTFLHSWQWGEFNRAIGHEINRLGVYHEDKLVAAALIVHTKARRGYFLLCPHGPVMRQGSDTQEILRALTDRLRDLAREKGCVFIRLSPTLTNTAEHDKFFFNLGYRNAPVHMVHPELGWILDIQATEETLLRDMRKSTRYSIKKAEKDGITVSMSSDEADLEKFWQVYETTVTRQHFAPFSKEYLRAEFKAFAAEGNVALFFAHYQGAITGTAFIVFDKHSAYYHHGATTQQYHGLTDAQLIQWHVIKEAKRRGCTQYNFWGVVPETIKNHPWTGLSLFKRGFGGREEAYVHAKDLSMSPRYWLTYAIERVRRIKRRL